MNPRLAAEIERLNLGGREVGRWATGPLSDDAVDEIEAQMGFDLPADYREFLSTNGGVTDLGESRVHVGRGLRGFQNGELLGNASEITYNKQRVLDTYNEGLVEDGAVIDSKWGDFLVPFAAQLPYHWYCFDFSFEFAPVVVLDSQANWVRDHEGFDGICYVADTFVEFLGLIEPSPTTEQIHTRFDPYASPSREVWETFLHDQLAPHIGSRPGGEFP